MKKFLFILFLLSFFLFGCEKNVPKELSVGIMSDVDSIPLIIASEMGYFENKGIVVKLDFFKSPVDRDSALQSGNLDGVISDVLAEVFAKEGGFDMKITSGTDGSYKLIVNKDKNIKSIQDLKNKDVAISKNTIIEYTTDMMLREEGLNSEDINKVIIPSIPTRLEMLQSGKIDAATLPEPLASVAINAGSVLLNSSDALNINPGVLLFTSDAVKNKSKEISEFYEAYNMAVDYINSGKDITDILIKNGFPELIKDSLILPSYTHAVLPDESQITDVIKWLYGKNLIKNSYSYGDLVEKKFTEK